MVLADLPYQTTRHQWDCAISIEPLWQEYRRIIKKNGAIVLTASQPFTTSLIVSNQSWFKYSWVWEKDIAGNFLNSKHQPLKVHEDVLVFSASASSHSPRGSMAYYPQKFPGNPYRRSAVKKGSHHNFHIKITNEFVSNAIVSDGKRMPRSVLRFSSERGFHPTQKPVPLFEYLILTYTNPGEVVLDNCFGSATTGVGCVNTCRRFIGVERDPHYFDVGRSRIDAAIAAASQPAPQGGLFDDQPSADLAESTAQCP